MQARGKSRLVLWLRTCTRARVLETPLIVVANRSYWQLGKSAIMLGGGTWPGAEDEHGHHAQGWQAHIEKYTTRPDVMYPPRRAAGALLALTVFPMLPGYHRWAFTIPWTTTLRSPIVTSGAEAYIRIATWV